MSANVGRNLLVVAALVILATVAAALWVMGGPGTQRDLRMDAERIQQLRRIEVFVADFHRNHGSLPQSLPVLAEQPGVALQITDPMSGQQYEYQVIGPRSYRLCAVFQTDTAHDVTGYALSEARWSHPMGGHCFTFEVPKEQADGK